mmetsp:Transcript_126918/g.355453  ORF Transcript_126918/g.355453 Transcript_126918/m.355453 type:complete len:100 (+) Transcript_126918:455-754(+)
MITCGGSSNSSGCKNNEVRAVRVGVLHCRVTTGANADPRATSSRHSSKVNVALTDFIILTDYLKTIEGQRSCFRNMKVERMKKTSNDHRREDDRSELLM